MEISGFEPDTISVGVQTAQHTRSVAAPSSSLDRVYARYLKRTLDIVGSLILILLLSWLFLIVAVLVRLTTPGNVIFRQTRLGKNLVPFTCYKFRSMVSEAETILQNDHSLKSIHAANWKLHADPRVTKLGNIIRKTSIDELPQLFNVLKGDMSLVGYRPVQVAEFAQQYGHVSHLMEDQTPGITGLWQVSGRSNLTYEKRIQLDLTYASKIGFATDLLILLKTIPVLLLRIGAK